MQTVEPIDLRRRWLAITAATVVMQFAYWPILGALVNADEGVITGMLAFGAAIVPFAFMTLAFASRHQNVGLATLKAMGLSLLVGLPLMLLLDWLAGLVAALAAGGTVTLQREQDVHSLKWRWAGVGMATVYVFVVRLLVVDFAVMSGAVLPFAVHGLVDQALETREPR